MVEQAAVAAQRAADAAGATIRELTDLTELRKVHTLYRTIWGSGAAAAPVSVEQLRAMSHMGNYLAGAFVDGELVGGCLGFFTAPPGHGLHSHIAGVALGARSRNVGYALKLHQRAWALARGLREITWTFDPLVRRNAYFNLVKLGARPREYLVNFYGDLDDSVNAGQGSDRLLVAWDLAAPQVATACDGRWAEAEPGRAASALAVGPDGAPTPTGTTASVVTVAIPEDVEEMRQQNPALGRAWRTAVREVLHGLMRGGAQVGGFSRGSGYLVQQ